MNSTKKTGSFTLLGLFDARGRHTVLGLGGLAILMPSAIGAPTPEAVRAADTGVQQEAARRADAVVLPPRMNGKTVIRADMPKRQTALSSLRLSVNGFKIENHPFIPAEEIDRVLAPWRGRELSFPEFERAVHAVADYLRENGHPNAQVVISRATIANGMVAVAVQGLEAGNPSTPTVAVREFNVTGLTMTATAEELKPILQPYAERDLTVAEMQTAAESVAAFLRNKGYPLVQAFLPPQKIDSGVIEIRVQEGIVDGKSGKDGVTVTGVGERVKPQVIETILSRAVVPGEPVRSEPLERAIRIAGDLPGIKSVRANMIPGSEPGTTQVQAIVEEGKLLSGSVWADNYINRYTGNFRVSGLLNLNSALGYGEQLSLNASASERMSSFKLAGQMPIGASGLRGGLSYADMRVDIGSEFFSSLNLNSSTKIGSAFLTYPLLRSETANVWLSANYDDKRVRNELQGLTLNDRHLRVATLATSGEFLDRWRGQNTWAVNFTAGDVDLSGDQGNQIIDRASAKTEGSFQKLNLNFARLTPLTSDGRIGFFANVSGQLASKNLDSVEKFQLGGPTGVRAYPLGEGLGDNGWMGNFELRGRVASGRFGDFGLFGFYDIGGVTQYKNTWTSPSGSSPDPNSYTLKGFGVGASLAKEGVGSVRVVVARKAGSNPNATGGNDSDGRSDDARVWVFGNIVF